MPDELHQPLGQGTATGAGPIAPGAPRRRSGWAVACGLLGSVAVAAGVFVARYGDPNGGNPRVVATIETVKPAPQAQAARDSEPTASIEGRRSERQTGQEVERQSGVKVTRAGGGEAPGALIIQLDEPSGVSLAPAPDKRLVERDRFGPLPRIGADGAKPWQVYARPVVLSQKLKPNAPRIALIVGGMGISQTTTQLAMEKLPADVSFAFAPYGDSLSSETTAARDAGHEIFLQAPMEPFDYPQNDPGPHTLNTKSTPDEAGVDLRWLMTRFTGYVGIVNFLGARFTASETALTPFMRELSSRGVAYVDDGSSPQSLAPDVARSKGAIAARADVVLDAEGKPEATEAALTKLEAIARQQGFALGVASAIPQSIERVARFTKGLESRGVALVPASAAFSRPNAPQADARRP